MRTATVIGAAVLAACVTTYKRKPYSTPYDPTHRSEIWKRAVALLAADGYPILVADEASGVITTAVSEREDTKKCGNMICEVRQSVSLTFGPDGTLSVNIIQEMRPDAVGRGIQSALSPQHGWVDWQKASWLKGAVDAIHDAQYKLALKVLGLPLPQEPPP